jgi:hypothetical protein
VKRPDVVVVDTESDRTLRPIGVTDELPQEDGFIPVHVDPLIAAEAVTDSILPLFP